MMRGRRAAVALLLLIVAGCKRNPVPAATATAPPPPSAIKPPADDATERDNLLNYARGTVVVARSGEFALWASALQAIDGDPETCWVAPPHEGSQWLLAALPARTRVEQIGLSNDALTTGGSVSVAFESSMDGVTFSPLGVVESRKKQNGLLFATRPTEARYVKVTSKEISAGGGVSLCSLQVRGVETVKRSPNDLTGCWSVNGSRLTLAQDGDHVFGQLEGPKPTVIDGGSDGRFVRFVWVRDREFGYGAFAVEESGKHLSGRIWHEEPIPIFAGEAWFGERSSCTGKTVLGGSTVASTFFQRAGRFPLYGLRAAADGSIEVSQSVATLRALDGLIRAAGTRHIRLEAHEFRQRDAASNHAFAGRELASLRALLGAAGVPLGTIELVVLGSDQPRHPPRTADQRALYSSIEVVIPAAKTLAR
jgi:hypothetical protein